MRYPQPTKPRSFKDVAKWFDSREKALQALLKMISDLAKLQREAVQTPEAEKHRRKIQDQREEITEIIDLLTALENVRTAKTVGATNSADAASK